MVQGTAMLLGYTEQAKNEDAIQFYPQMVVQDGRFRAIEKGSEVHSRI